MRLGRGGDGRVSLVPVIVLTALAGTQLREAPVAPVRRGGGESPHGLGLGARDHDVELLGLGRAHTTLGEDARRRPELPPRGVGRLALITLAYVLPVAASLSAWTAGRTGNRPLAGRRGGGRRAVARQPGRAGR